MSNKKTIKRAMALALASTTLFAGAISANAEKVTYDTSPLTADGDNPTIRTYEDIAEDYHNDFSDKIVILSTNDIHGAVQDYAYIAALKNYFSKSTNNGGLGASGVILVDSGDFGADKTDKDGEHVDDSKLVGHVNDNPEKLIDIMEAVGYDYVEWGNHEYSSSNGFKKFEKLVNSSKIKIINSNIMKQGGKEHAFTPHDIKENKETNIKIGFFGLDTHEIYEKDDNNKTFDFKDLVKASNDEVKNLKDEGADIIICLSHLGLQDDYSPYKIDKKNGADLEKYSENEYDYTGDPGKRSADIWALTSDEKGGHGIDLMLDGHSHTAVNNGDGINTAPIMSTKIWCQYIGITIVGKKDGKAVIEHRYLIPDSDFENSSLLENHGSDEVNQLIEDILKDGKDDKKPGNGKTPGKNSDKNNDKNGKNNKNTKGNNKFNKREWNEEDLEYGVTEDTEVTSSEASTETSVTEDAQITDEAKDQNSTQAATNASDEASAQDSAETDVQENADTEVEPAA